jgi:hypothetical protein
MKLRKLLGYISLRWREPESCESCNGQFKCGATITGCWCVGIKLSPSVRKDLRSRYQKCLCRDCLERFAKMDQSVDKHK